MPLPEGATILREIDGGKKDLRCPHAHALSTTRRKVKNEAYLLESCRRAHFDNSPLHVKVTATVQLNSTVGSAGPFFVTFIR